MTRRSEPRDYKRCSWVETWVQPQRLINWSQNWEVRESQVKGHSQLYNELELEVSHETLSKINYYSNEINFGTVTPNLLFFFNQWLKIHKPRHEQELPETDSGMNPAHTPYTYSVLSSGRAAISFMQLMQFKLMKRKLKFQPIAVALVIAHSGCQLDCTWN